ncbi:virion protein [Photobacterium sp. SDRW27]|uniref:virion protein n=1 Tax=Photobacterium obscurum TaxID=2829490 RepID=UPI0022437852|nr:virion protein [Photobacterium obscurum]MCW8330871.1 virion protein [Photobacterium obscurum]
MRWLWALSAIAAVWMLYRAQHSDSGQSWSNLTGMTDDMTSGKPRGIRNNNPLNIEYSKRNKWRGQVGTDGRFVIFEDDKYGFRAAARVLRSYQRRGINTIHSIVHTFAPDNENESDHYANMVAQWTGYGKHQQLDVHNDDTAMVVIKAMARMEVGHSYSTAEVMEGVALA